MPQDNKTKETSLQSSSTSKIKPINLEESNLAKEWKNWFIQFKIFLRASALENDDDSRKTALLLHHMGPDCLEIFSSFNVDIDKIKYDDLVKKFEDYFVPKANTALERHKFFTRSQRPNESIEDYVTALKNLSLNCEFGSLREDLVKDIFICGLRENLRFIKEKLLNEENIKLEKAVQTAKLLETSRLQALQLDHVASTSTTFVGALSSKSHESQTKGQKMTYKKNFYSKQQSHNDNKKDKKKNKTQICRRCGQVHKYRCPAQGVICKKCKKPNHFAKMCNKKKINAIEVESDDQKSTHTEENDLFMGVIRESNNSSLWFTTIMISGREVKVQLDTGAQTNVMSFKKFKELNLNKENIVPSKTNILTFSGEKIKLIGKCEIPCMIRNKQETISFHIANLNCQTVFGLPTCVQFNLVSKIDIINSEKQNNSICVFQEYQDVFSGIGSLKVECNFKINPSVQPTVEYPRRIPFKLHEPLKKELNRLISIQVIDQIDEPTEWVNSIVLVSKPNGELRLCLDPRNLNKAIMRPHFQFPTIEEIKAKLYGCKFFTKLDAASGFWSIPLSQESSKLCTFITPFGRFRFLRLPFGINAAPEIFHSLMVKLFNDIKSIVIYIDDFLIAEPTKEAHDLKLKLVLDRARQIGLKFNKDKCVICAHEIKFLGHVFNSQGVLPDPTKVETICSMQPPKNVKELQRFLGMVNYLGSFIPNLSSQTTNLRQLLKKDVLWYWSTVHGTEFNKLKNLLCNAPILTYYNANKPLTLSVDASKDALGAVILHDKNPIAYASGSLTETQIQYSQIEKELLAVLFGCTRFHQYIFGHKVKVETDHKPLVTLFSKPLYKVPPRLQRLMLKLQAYDLSVVYVPGKLMYIADTLSRHALFEKSLVKLDDEINLHVNLLMQNLSLSQSYLDIIRDETKIDKTLQIIIGYIKSGWPVTIKQVETEAKPYYTFREELHTSSNLLLKGSSIVIPIKLRPKILKLLHEGHLGIERTKDLARGNIFWPGLKNDISNIVNNCEICISYRKNNQKMPLLSHDPGDIPWEKVGVDIFELHKRKFLLVVDYFSKYIEIAHLDRGSDSQKVITQLKSIFARHGIPYTLISDNGPPYNSEKFKEFCIDWGIEHITASPYHPKSNGQAERSIGIIKNLLKKSIDSGTDPYIALLQYRTAPRGNFSSPAQLLMSRQLRTKLPTIKTQLYPKVVDLNKHKMQLKQYKNQIEKNYNKTSKDLKPLTEGEKVYYKKTPSSKWEPAKVREKCSQPRSYIVEDTLGHLYRRTREQLLKPKTSSTSSQSTEVADEDSKLDVDESPKPNQITTRYGRQIKSPKRYCPCK